MNQLHHTNNNNIEKINKYKQLKQQLQQYDTNPQQATTNTTTNSLENTAFFYFNSLSSLSTDILLQENDISQLKNKIEFMKSRYSLMALKYAQKKKKQQQKRLVHCQQQNCKESFEKDKQLHYHKLFTHEDSRMFENVRFNFSVGENNQEEQQSKE